MGKTTISQPFGNGRNVSPIHGDDWGVVNMALFYQHEWNILLKWVIWGVASWIGNFFNVNDRLRRARKACGRRGSMGFFWVTTLAWTCAWSFQYTLPVELPSMAMQPPKPVGCSYDLPAIMKRHWGSGVIDKNNFGISNTSLEWMSSYNSLQLLWIHKSLPTFHEKFHRLRSYATGSGDTGPPNDGSVEFHERFA